MSYIYIYIYIYIYKSAVNARERETTLSRCLSTLKLSEKSLSLSLSLFTLSLYYFVSLLHDGDRFCPEPKPGVELCLGKNQPVLRFDVRARTPMKPVFAFRSDWFLSRSSSRDEIFERRRDDEAKRERTSREVRERVMYFSRHISVRVVLRENVEGSVYIWDI